jgi:hypothetical protein
MIMTGNTWTTAAWVFLAICSANIIQASLVNGDEITKSVALSFISAILIFAVIRFLVVAQELEWSDENGIVKWLFCSTNRRGAVPTDVSPDSDFALHRSITKAWDKNGVTWWAIMSAACDRGQLKNPWTRATISSISSRDGSFVILWFCLTVWFLKEPILIFNQMCSSAFSWTLPWSEDAEFLVYFFSYAGLNLQDLALSCSLDICKGGTSVVMFSFMLGMTRTLSHFLFTI